MKTNEKIFIFLMIQYPFFPLVPIYVQRAGDTKEGQKRCSLPSRSIKPGVGDKNSRRYM